MSKGGPANPAVDRDKRSMERKKRVTEVLEDQFRNELEGVVVAQKEGNKPLFHAGIRINGGRTGGTEFKGLANIRQVNDLHGSMRDKYSKAERELRCKLAALYRLTAHFEWDHIIYSHITARLPDNENHFLINPYGMQYSEITASSLIKIDKDGNIIDSGSTVLPVNKAGFKLNSALHDIGQNVVYHTHSHAGTAISAMKCGLLNLCQEAIIVRPVSYGTYQGFVPNKAEQSQLQEDLMDESHVMILENHGLVSVAPTIEEAFLWMAELTKACEIQWRVLRCGRDNLTDRTFFESNEAYEGDLPVELVCNPNGVEYGKGELEFESYMRMLDTQGVNTGYPYKTPSLFKDQVPSYPNVQYPPIVPGMEGPPSDTDKSKTGSSTQRSAWFRNNIPVEQRISPPSDRKSDKDGRGKGDGKRFAPFDSVVSPPASRSGSSSSSSGGGRRKRSSLTSSSESDGEAPPRPPPPPPSKRKHSGKSSSSKSSSRKSSCNSSSRSSDKMASEGSEGYAEILADGKHPEDKMASEGSEGYSRILGDDGKPPERRQAHSSTSSSEGGGPDRPPLPQDHSSEDGYHSTKSGSETDEQTTHDYISEERVEQEVFVNGVPVLRHGSSSSASGSSLEEVPPLSIQSIHSSSDSDVISDPSTDGKRSDEADVQSLSDDSPSLEVVVDGDLPPSVECESLDEVEEMPIVEAGRFDQVEEAGRWMQKRLDKLGESGVLDPDEVEVEPAFAGRPNVKRAVSGDTVPGVPGQQAAPISSGSEGWDTPDEQDKPADVGGLEPSFAGKPNLKRPVRGDKVARVPGQQAASISSSSEAGEQEEEFQTARGSDVQSDEGSEKRPDKVTESGKGPEKDKRRGSKPGDSPDGGSSRSGSDPELLEPGSGSEPEYAGQSSEAEHAEQGSSAELREEEKEREKERDPWEGIPILSRDVSVDAKMSVTTDMDVQHDVGVEVEVRVGEDGVEIHDEITVNTVTTSIIEITEIQEDEFEVITIQPGQLTDDQKNELIRQGYVLQEN